MVDALGHMPSLRLYLAIPTTKSKSNASAAAAATRTSARRTTQPGDGRDH